MRHIPIFTFINKMDLRRWIHFGTIRMILKMNWECDLSGQWRSAPVGVVVSMTVLRECGIILRIQEGTTQGEVQIVPIDDPSLNGLISEEQKAKLEEEIELQDGAGAELDQEMVSKRRTFTGILRICSDDLE